MSLFRGLIGKQSENIVNRLTAEVGFTASLRFQVSSKELPSYRFVDLHRSINDYCQSRGRVRHIESEHNEDLNDILHGKRPRWVSRQIKQSQRIAWPTGPQREAYLSLDSSWVVGETESGAEDQLIIRLRYIQYNERAALEVGGMIATLVEGCLREILERSVNKSIYRNQVLELTFEAGTRDEYGDVEKPERLRILFKATDPVDDRDIIIDENVRKILWRNVIDLHLRRDVLKANRVPVRRGVLLYGPPGTGKTFACRYLCGKLPMTTRIIITGTSLLQVTHIFNLARMLQPSLVILEDVDLVFAAREVNLYSSVLGDLLDQMDGLRPYEDIGFVLTTNAIHRMEAAIKDRPGRISQCIYFGPPQPELRKRYLTHYLRSYETSNLNLDKLVGESEGATQAFLKEWVHRSVQIASERLDEPDCSLELHNEDFRQAMGEMKRFSEGSTGGIIGFHRT